MSTEAGAPGTGTSQGGAPEAGAPGADGTDEAARSAAGPGTGAAAPAAAPRRRVLRWTALATALALLGTTGYCVHDALTAPGKAGAMSKIAQWGRCHGLGQVGDLVGSTRPSSADGCARTAAPITVKAAAAPVKPKPKPPPTIPLHAAVRTLVSPAQRGEGVFAPLVSVKGQAVVQRALMRPDDYDTGFPVGVVWMKRSALRFDLHPGAAEPGGWWPVPPTIPPGRRTGLVAAFNGGFKMSNGDSHGGFYLDGRTFGDLRTGAASEVFHRDGSLTVGVWNEDVRMAPDVVGVRQCLVPLVAHGQVTPEVHDGGTDTWGFTDGGNSFVARSGVGVDRNGDIIYVGGRLMSVWTLAATLQRAGAVTAMMLDINISWPSFISYDAGRTPADPVPHNLVNFVRDPTRYYDSSSRDFVAVYAR